MNKVKVSKIMLWPSRKINLGNYETVDLNAGVEMVFDTPVDLKSKELQKALDEARTLIREEFKKQYAPYQKLVVKKLDTPKEGKYDKFS